MSDIRTFSRSFAGGEVTPEFWGRIDDVKYQTGLAKCRNFICLPHGPLANRPGFEFVRAVKSSLTKVRLIPFSFSITQTMMLEFGVGYIRFHTMGATLLAGTPAAHSGATPYVAGDLVSFGGVNYHCILAHTAQAPPNATYWYPLPTEAYEIPSPYAEADLPDIHFVQSADVLTLVHPGYRPRELRRLGATKWALVVVAFAPTSLAPAGAPTVTATRHASPTDLTHYKYKITTVVDSEESLGGTEGTTNITNNLFQTGAFNTITWGAAAGATRYYVYRQDNGLFGYVGQTDALTFKDDGITPDLSRTPPLLRDPFITTDNYPTAVSYYQQRRVFAGTNKQPQNLWATKSATESNLTYSLPSREDDSLSFKIAAREANAIRHIVPLQDMVLLTNSAEWRIEGSDGPLSPSNVEAGPQSYVGANNVQPIIVNNSLLYAAARGGHVREMGFSTDAGGYITGDLSLRAPHLFNQKRIVDMAYSKAPVPICWFVSSSGKLIGLTYIPEQQIGAWHQHDTVGGKFESIAVVAEGEEDVLYAVVLRTIGGAPVRYIERLHTRSFGDPDNDEELAQEDAFFVDSGLTYSGAPVSTISGLAHLEGETVSILVDGAVHPRRVVTAGAVSLDIPGSVVHVGLKIEADVRTLPLAFEIPGYGQGRTKNVNKIWIRVYRSSGIFTGPSLDALVEAKQRTTEAWGSPPDLKTEEIEVVTKSAWTDSGSMFVRQADPLPLTIVSMSLEVAIGG